MEVEPGGDEVEAMETILADATWAHLPLGLAPA